MRGKPHSDEVRAQVMAALLAGQGVMEVAARYRLPKATVSRIKNSLTAEQLEQIGTEKKDRIGNLLLGAVAANVEALRSIAETVSEPPYIRGQSAESVGMLYGILADKAVRFLEAAEFAAGAEEDREGAADVP